MPRMVSMIDAITWGRFQLKLAELIALANKQYNREFTGISLEFRQMGRKAGLAWYNTSKIELNSDFCKNGHLEDLINRTLPHELAHIISYRVYGLTGRGHKRFWKSVMRVFGVTPNRCHSYSLEDVKTHTVQRQYFQYECGCAGRKLRVSSVKHNRQARGRAKYFCVRCREVIRYTGLWP